MLMVVLAAAPAPPMSPPGVTENTIRPPCVLVVSKLRASSSAVE